MTNPFVGLRVLYRPGPYDKGVQIGDGLFSAIITHVHSSSCVNIAYFDSLGVAYSRTNASVWDGVGEAPRDQYAELGTVKP